MAASIKGFLECNPKQLCINTVFVSGQSFRWKQCGFGEWIGVMAGHVWRLKQISNKIHYQVYSSSKDEILDGRAKHLLNETTAQVSLETPSGDNDSSKNSFANLDIVKNETEDDSKFATARHTQKPCSKSMLVSQKATFGIKMEANDSCEESKSHLKTNHSEFSQILYDYFQLDVDLDAMYQDWSKRDSHFAKVAGHFKGIRMLRQEPVENLLSFVCSSNNNISRISSMVEKMCIHYGKYITTVDGEEYYDFPSLSALCGEEVEPQLRELGFGYRAKFIANIARHITQEKGGDDWVQSLRGSSYLEAKSELLALYGVGPKVADCVCLMSLDKPGAVPVDTHVWQFTAKHYIPRLNSVKSLTDKIYKEIGDFYRDLWGPYAGWAHSVLFTADLKQNKERAALVEGESKSAQGDKAESKSPEESSSVESGEKSTAKKKKNK